MKKPMDFGFNKMTRALLRKAATFDFPTTLAKSAVALPADRIIRERIGQDKQDGRPRCGDKNSRYDQEWD